MLAVRIQLWICIISGVTGGRHEVDLINTLLNDYQSMERPSEDEHSALKVEFQITLRSIIDVEEKNQLIITNLWLDYRWVDYKLQWNPADYGNITEIRLPEKKIWKPDILMYNSADPAFDGSYGVNVVLYHNGTLTQTPPGIFTSRCPIDIKWFPFDDQGCTLKFGSWSYDGSKINLQIKDGYKDGSMDGYTESGEWDMMSLPGVRNVVRYSCCPDNPYIDITYTINIRRRKLYYIVNIVTPCLMLASLTLVTFTIPPDAGEKISFGVTILLSLTVFLLMVAEALPASSDAVPLIALYFSAVMLLNAASVVFTVIVLNYHHRSSETHTMPKWVKKGICEWLAWILRLKRPGHSFDAERLCSKARVSKEISQDYSNDSNCKRLLSNGENFSSNPPESSFVQNKDWERQKPRPEPLSTDHVHPRCELRLRAIQKDLKLIADKIKAKEEDDQITSDWKFAATVIDRFLLWFFSIATFLATVIILFGAPNMFSAAVST